MVMKKKYLKLISTDSVGWLGSPEQFIELYGNYFKDGTFDGVEMIAFKPLKKLKNFISILNQHHIPTISFHSKTGGENRLSPKYGIIMTIVNYFIFGVENLILNFKDKEFLSHTPYLENKKVKNFIVFHKPKVLWIENHLYGQKGIEDAKNQIIDYLKKGINAHGMLDLYHLLAKVPTKELVKTWPKIVAEISNYLRWFSGIHLPIGSRKNDSLPIEQITDEMLELFAEKIVPYLDRVVIENQQKNLGLFFSTNKMIKEQKKRNEVNFLRLKKAGIL
ncbi:hypothetical protein COY13_01830 [Candidatus Roizmanbacteria bacterium CG_4_10_14_0_2_um_filter_36_35]|uniref:Xylose isomerase-like TIM barrel domain-containing protein n=5 Tax=Candidatus Roizmaniibacteriota TaxID=1752723 RepID=A0A2M7UA98_9BACT|nr:MAG: hypothetical protein COV86_04500 [Candidatus Roizmanbacteria bacterium CG11_big_fil_rev_8_21_14_0_20_35_14]PIZ68148.1 MAG: hypothetical protein COY13_01830 [Candidatus Roizmanbacteria bacterium CG_4_10_14_0_2_um_filter_36_35]PJC32318.1 MAG: hypothetical protein CO049_03235 [Candidatus Roizmanbacteria bacterium CG_4_9_14_0_2_um_filter_36_12]